ncbi:MAG: hypothetical protein E7356_02560 [Clostridiales bacterium]|nr:hypothetical protein [Clostridiales bacterium]
MESEEKMTLRDMPVDTRNYTIIDNITGKPIDQSNYTLTIDNEVIKKLNALKQINEEKIKEAALRDKYGNSTLVDTFTPTDNAVFTPVYNDDYIEYQDYNDKPVEDTPKEEEVAVEESPIEETAGATVGHAEVIQSDTLLDRVVARDPSVRIAEEEAAKQAEEPKEELDYISNYDPNNEDGTPTQEDIANELQADNSLFTPEMATLQDASEQIVNINTDKLGQDIKPVKTSRRAEKIDLDKMEIIAGRWVAWMAYILFFIPLLFRRKNRFVRLHANEGLELNIMEILAALLVGQYFLLPTITTVTGALSLISILACAVGAGLACTCVFTIVIMAILALCGKYCQTPWLWKKRIIKVPSERTSD